MEWTWTPEAVQAELDYRRGDLKAREQRRAVMLAHPTWWQRLRAQRPAHDRDDGGKRAA